MDTSQSSIESDNYEFCEATGQSASLLYFDPAKLEGLLLALFDTFDFRVVLSDERTRVAAVVTTGLSLAGGLIGKRLGGNYGAAIGGVVGGAVGLGLADVKLREIWEEVKYKLAHLTDILYDYLGEMDVKDYAQAARILTQDREFAVIVGQLAQTSLGQRVLHDIMPQ